MLHFHKAYNFLFSKIFLYRFFLSMWNSCFYFINLLIKNITFCYKGGIFIRTARTHKDHLFIRIFQEKEDLLQLYNAVNDSHYTNPGDLQIVTLEDALYLSMKNDLSFIISSELNLYEHQSTICPNMPLRGLFYLASQYKGLIADTPNALYSSRQINLPVPRYIVFYNGEAKQPERQILKLSDAFEKQSEYACLECKAEVLNINYDHNKKLQSACKTLCDYAILVEKIRQNRKKSNTLEEAVNQAVEQCIQEGILKDFLLKHRGEVTDMILSQYDEEAYIKSEKAISFEDGYNQAQEELQPIIAEKDSKILEQNSQLLEQNSLIQEQQNLIEQMKQTIDSLSKK